MTEDDDNLQLDLLVPWELPIEQPLNEVDRAIVGRVLNQLLQVLNQSSSETVLAIIDRLLAKLNTIDTSPARISSTKTALKSWEVEDFDFYFRVNHVQTPQPALCIVKSLVLTYRTFVLLNYQNHFDPAQVERQKQGFISYVYLLSRVFHINLEETE